MFEYIRQRSKEDIDLKRVRTKVGRAVAASILVAFPLVSPRIRGAEACARRPDGTVVMYTAPDVGPPARRSFNSMPECLEELLSGGRKEMSW